MAKIKDPYWESSRCWLNAKCDKCNTRQGWDIKHRVTFHRYFVPINWFRGDDELAKTLCSKCYKERTVSR